MQPNVCKGLRRISPTPLCSCCNRPNTAVGGTNHARHFGAFVPPNQPTVVPVCTSLYHPLACICWVKSLVVQGGTRWYKALACGGTTVHTSIDVPLVPRPTRYLHQSRTQQRKPAQVMQRFRHEVAFAHRFNPPRVRHMPGVQLTQLRVGPMATPNRVPPLLQ